MGAGLRFGLLAGCLALVACGDDGGGAPCDGFDVATGAPPGTSCPFVPKLPAGETACRPSAVAGREPRIAVHGDGTNVRAWRDGDDVIVETTGGTACGVRHRVPATGGVRGFEVAIDDAHADIAWSDDAGVSVLELAHDGSDATYVLPGMTSLTRWVALGDGRRVSMPGTDGRPAIWRSGSRVGVLMIDADAGDVTQLDGLVAVAVEAGPLAFFDVPTFPSERPPRAVLELDPAGFRRPALAWLDGDLVVAWEVTRDGRELVRGARVDGGNQLGTTARVLIGPYDLMDGRRPKLGTTSTRVVIGTPYPGDCGDVVILSWRDTAFETIVDRDLLVDLDEAGDGFRFASGAAEVTIAATQVLLTRSETGQVEPACASPMFARITDSGETGVVLPGASP